MDNNTLVDLVKMNENALRLKSPIDEKVLEAMQHVDRVEFLPDLKTRYYVTEDQVVYAINQAFNKLKKLKLPIREAKFAFKARDAIKYREAEVELSSKDLGYFDMALEIGEGQTCSQPAMVAVMADILELDNGMKVYEVGLGCGYSAAVTCHLIGEDGFLVSAEIIPRLFELGKENLKKHFGNRTLEKMAKLVLGDGSSGVELVGFDRIYLTGKVNSATFNPKELAKYLNPNFGILLFPTDSGYLIKQIYRNDKIIDERLFGEGNIGFVPLVGQNS